MFDSFIHSFIYSELFKDLLRCAQVRELKVQWWRKPTKNTVKVLGIPESQRESLPGRIAFALQTIKHFTIPRGLLLFLIEPNLVCLALKKRSTYELPTLYVLYLEKINEKLL